MKHLLNAIWKNTRMRVKFLVVTTIVLGFFMGCSLYITISRHTATSMNLVEKHSDRLLENTYSAMKFPMSVGDSNTVEEQLKAIKQQMKGVQVYISDPEQEIIYASAEERLHNRLADYIQSQEVQQALTETLHTGAMPRMSLLDQEGQEPFLVSIKPILNEPSCHHCHTDYRKVLGAIVAKESIKEVLDSIQATRNELILYTIVALISLLLFLNFFFARLVTRRIEALMEKTSQVAAGDVTVVAQTDYQDSIGKLTEHFNQMITSIRDRMEYANSLKLGISDPFFTVDPQMQVTFVNEPMAHMAGLAPAEIIGKPCSQVFKSSACNTGCPVKRALQTGRSTVGNRLTLTDYKGRDVPLMTSASVLRDSSGTILGAIEILRDLTAEVKAEKMLQDAYCREEQEKQAIESKVSELSEVLARVGQGDFTIRATATGTNEIMELMVVRINETLDRMQAMISQVNDHINPLMAGVEKISCENQNLASRTQHQMAAMQEISATLIELVANTRQNLANTHRADSLSKGAVQVAGHGGDLVEKTAQAMLEMAEASQKVVEMVELINEITFQTNLLSVNAAVEAARAGEHGRGFAVVASEVRSLAKRSAASAKDIQALVRTTINSTSGVRQWVDQLQEFFSKIVGSSEEVSRALGDISVTSEEDARGINHINDRIQEMLGVTEQNATFVQQTAATAEELNGSVDQLRKVQEIFILEEQGSSPARAAAMAFPDFRKPGGCSPPLPHRKQAALCVKTGASEYGDGPQTADDDRLEDC